MYFWTVVKWNVKTKWENEENQVFLNKKDPMAQKKNSIKHDNTIEEVMQNRFVNTN